MNQSISPIPRFQSMWSDQMLEHLQKKQHELGQEHFEAFLLSHAWRICDSWGDVDKPDVLKRLFNRKVLKIEDGCREFLIKISEEWAIQ